MTLDDRIAQALDLIHDPCSIAAGRPTSLRAMGLVRGWRLDDGVLTVTFAVTFPGCTMAPHFTQAARDALLALPGIDRVLTPVDTEFGWTPAAMTGAAPPAIRHGRPQEWRNRQSNG